MKIRKFIAPTLAEALARVHQELGKDAVILKARFNNGGGPHSRQKSIELTAAVDPSQLTHTIDLTEVASEMPRPKNRLELKSIHPATPPGLRKTEPRQPLSELLHEIKDDIAAIRREFAELSRQSLFGLPSAIQIDLARRLIQRSLPESLAIQVAQKAASSPKADFDRAHIWNDAGLALCDLISASEPTRLSASGTTVVFLLGPAGAGKTSSAARLAYHFRAENRIPVTLVSADKFGPDSNVQMRSIAGILGCTFISLSSPEELADALGSCRDGLVIVDTAGPGDNGDIAGLTGLVDVAKTPEIHLVVAADTPADDIKRFIGNYPDLKINRLLVTKLDQTRNRGGVIAAAIDCGLKFSYQSASREIPGRFCAFDPQTFVDAMLADDLAPMRIPEDSFEVVGW